jgi:hypothetical protein
MVAPLDDAQWLVDARLMVERTELLSPEGIWL